MNISSLVGLSAAAILALSPAALAADHSATPAARSAGQPIAQSVILDGHLTTPTQLDLHYVIAGNTAVFSDPELGRSSRTAASSGRSGCTSAASSAAAAMPAPWSAPATPG